MTRPDGWFAVDAGGSGTRVRCAAADGATWTACYPTVNPASSGAGADATLAALCADLRDRLTGRWAGWFAGATVDADTVDAQAERLRRAGAPAADLVLSNDLVPMVWGVPALAGTGVAVVCGTGSGHFGARADGATARAGGCEYLGSDEGSAFDLGLRGLRAAVRAGDGRGPATKLTALLAAHAGRQVTDLARGLALGASPKRPLAALAPLVCSAWLDGDAVAARLVAEAVEELALGVRAVAGRLELPAPYGVAVLGGLLTGRPQLRELLQARLTASGAGVVVHVPDPVSAVLAALRHVAGPDGWPVLPPGLRPHARLVRL
ncbi:BadF/BadG/BcrA/BcrD ATPase family protein [Dactylosporangium sp. NPDC048998]|uniref:BadF/BadG/BcrA/BcrD ATPase family protein n=1 Tax=Dactylosporangium sp. NPDC048998 TaxID=3363976 RepID=UPI00371266E5